ncbi:chemotaxis protein [Bifidobacterium simiiventris]|uniref:chemotaxis protein n=1 Tax=Bifidobacterium simiiventris TaxID=2834434 RepID=UPI001C5599F1|nr:chemotaxis protein [Bifidobacterium simiiventris]MBW3079252.1 chemotaxis protein [Bifidobacterium simiiventris]
MGDALGGLVEEHISVDQIGAVAGAIREQGENLDLGSIADRTGLPTDVIGQISGLLGH